MIERAGELDIPGWHRHAKEVVGTNGSAPCISTQSNNLKTKIPIEGELTDSNFTKVISNDEDKGENR